MPLTSLHRLPLCCLSCLSNLQGARWQTDHLLQSCCLTHAAHAGCLCSLLQRQLWDESLSHAYTLITKNAFSCTKQKKQHTHGVYVQQRTHFISFLLINRYTEGHMSVQSRTEQNTFWYTLTSVLLSLLCALKRKFFIVIPIKSVIPIHILNFEFHGPRNISGKENEMAPFSSSGLIQVSGGPDIPNRFENNVFYTFNVKLPRRGVCSRFQLCSFAALQPQWRFQLKKACK